MSHKLQQQRSEWPMVTLSLTWHASCKYNYKVHVYKLHQKYILIKIGKEVPLSTFEFVHLVFALMLGESYHRWPRSLLLCLCDVFRVLINWICWLLCEPWLWCRWGTSSRCDWHVWVSGRIDGNTFHPARIARLCCSGPALFQVRRPAIHTRGCHIWLLWGLTLDYFLLLVFLLTFSIDDLRKSRGLHSISAYKHGLSIQVPACGCSAE